MNNRLNLLGLGIALILSSFIPYADTYQEEIAAWHKTRIENLKSENGWLNLAGLFWLKEGEQSIGSDKSNNILFPLNHSEAHLGNIVLKNGQVSFISADFADVYHDGKRVDRISLFPYTGKPILLEHQSLKWFIIQRGDAYAIRLRDLKAPSLLEFKGIEIFPINNTWRIKAEFIPEINNKLTITDVTGRNYSEHSPGKLFFTIDGKEYNLTCTGSIEKLSVVFGDLTNGDETYGGGRFLTAEGPVTDGYTYLDFNKAYNPPCAFTPYATCPRPIEENKLQVAILAGEKNYGDH